MSATPHLGLDPARAADPARYAIAGAPPGQALRPATRAEAAAALAAAARDRLQVVPWGGGVSLACERAPGHEGARYDVALDLSGLDRIVEYEPDDLTVTAECGATLGALRAALAAHGHELPLEGARAGRATLGGALAGNSSGPRRLRFGSPRDRVLGARFLMGDGTLIHTGGKVVKNVAGYAVHRLLCGSRGGLTVLLEASLKLMPAPARRVALLYGAGAKELADRARWAGLPRLEPAVLSVVGGSLAHALAWSSPTGPFTTIVGFEEDEARVAEQVSAATRALGEPDARFEDDAAAALWQALANLEDAPGARLALTTADNLPAALAPLLEAPEAWSGFLFHAAGGRLHLSPGTARAKPVVERLHRSGFTLIEAVVGEDDPAGVAALEPFLTPQAAVLDLRVRLRAALDPCGTLAYGARWQRGEAP